MPTTQGHDYPALELEEAQFPRYEGKVLQPTGELVHVQVDHKPPKTAMIVRTGTVDKAKLEAALGQARVLAVGPEVSKVAPGDVVLLEQHKFSGIKRFDIFPDGTALYQQEAIVAVVERT